MKSFARPYVQLALMACALLPATQHAWAAPHDTSPTGMASAATVGQAAEAFLREQLAALPGDATITLDPIDTSRTPSCAALDPFLPSALRVRSRMTVGVRCAGPQPWTLYVQANVSIRGQYYVAARMIAAGQAIGEADLAPREGDLVTLPRGVVLDPAAILGMRARYRITAGQTIKGTALRSAQAVTRGQQVRITARGPGFEVSSEGEALDNAPPGAPVQVRTTSGQIVSGIVRNATLVEVAL
ncbi:flagellar basal body P-ring formation chaperone FlgA [Bordetella petrii]|uniref:flagellar basal body P-ring formation chaperone FlgA n=1 Tax=Bordetella petrii TaxID=94624 RepID=UPI001E55AC90|nr:flagellar basal body P-ring formation chaperone FlgA [Bordetella petrii]MCD0505024.1 flagellar basal body P-ring formation protein FlgA [Bordetella petrii]